ncbi:flavin monoamine oxidase family protein [Longispora albida]|uniref:flavin monoamine oxidase family protein n=1 Tax=Longispora albida TaxID=203523 RepID=UPI0003602C02|nr:flavin monoamine oxidase family protein [Longispora albida]
MSEPANALPAGAGGLPEPSGRPSPAAAAPVPDSILDVVTAGLGRREQHPKRVIVIGAGMAGLVAAFELQRQGHEPVVLEAQNRVGGRVYTMRDFAPGLYAEAGAMRIPRVHTLTLEYCKLFGLKMRPFVMGNARTLLHVAGRTMTFADADADPGRLPFQLTEAERGKTWMQMWDEATAEIKQAYDEAGQAGWERIVQQYDDMSLREFLEHKGWSEGAIEMYAILSFREQNMNTAVIEQFFELIGRSFEDMRYIEGGTDLLARAFYERIEQCVRFGAAVKAIEQDADGVTVHYANAAGRFSERGDYAICTLPFPVLSNIEVSPALSPSKRQAIRELRYNASTKILFQVRRRFWESEPYGIVGGTTATDLPIRRVVYPSAADPDSERGILLASYTWGQDALRWGSMSEKDRIEEALEDVAKIHPEIREEFEVGASHAWFSDPYAGGAFAQFEPGQATRMQKHILAPEGRIYFAGEHCSLYHAWIQGALESGIRAAATIHSLPAPETARELITV